MAGDTELGVLPRHNGDGMGLPLEGGSRGNSVGHIQIKTPSIDLAPHPPTPHQVALVRGCIPVIMMDGVKAEFEDELPLKDYSIRIPGFMAYK